MPVDKSVQTTSVISDAALRNVLRRQIHKATKVAPRPFSRHTLAEESGVNVHQLDQIISTQEEKHRRVALADALSIAMVLGDGAVNALLAQIGYGGAHPLDEPDALQPVQMVMAATEQLGRIARAAADNRIDHLEEPETTEAADIIIATLTPISSGRRVA